ncbi:hypothetical protein DSAG12_04125 [Promethearchaeum syntrophicum]|uniref:Uncharacterized protein n=1 Tax=Promethearchaeum syntrophicum TaxID=2594042 RepID=A0AC61ZTY7_9ARCH|nr:hypothetical protein [Candidatus Prometheoarchaeum syntrophicum]
MQLKKPKAQILKFLFNVSIMSEQKQITEPDHQNLFQTLLG